MVDGRTERARRQREERRGQILSAARRVIASKGYPSTSVADVIEAAGISRGTFYLYFESREKLFIDLVDTFLAKLSNAVLVIGLDDDAPKEKLFENFRRVIDILVKEADLTTVLFREAVGVSPQIDARVNEFYASLHRLVVGALRRGVRRGITRPIQDDELVATGIVGMVKEVIYTRVVTRRGGEAPDSDRITAVIFDFALRGLLPATRSVS